MNKERRKSIEEIRDKLYKAQDIIAECRDDIENSQGRGR